MMPQVLNFQVESEVIYVLAKTSYKSSNDDSNQLEYKVTRGPHPCYKDETVVIH